MKIVDNMIFEAEVVESPNYSGEMTPSVVVIHYTGDNSMQGAVSWLGSEDSQVSAHLVIGKDGRLVQMVPFNLRAWHAGRSSFRGRPFVNSFSIGIENVGVGDLWPDSQMQTLLACLDAIVAAYPIEAIVGHCDVAPGRKVDPGPNFPWEVLQARYPNLSFRA